MQMWEMTPGPELSPQQLMKPGYTFSCVVGIYSSGHVLLAGLPAPFVTDEQCLLDGGQGIGTIIMIDSNRRE